MYVFRGLYFNVSDFGPDMYDINNNEDDQMKTMKSMCYSGWDTKLQTKWSVL